MRRFLRGLSGGGSPEHGMAVAVENSGKAMAAVVREVVAAETVRCDFEELARLIDTALRGIEAARIPIDEYGDLFNMNERFIRKRVSGGMEEVALIVDVPGIGDDPRFSHLFAPEEENTIGPGIHYGTLTLNGQELKSPVGRSFKTYTRRDFGLIVLGAFNMVQRSYEPM